MAPLTLLFWHLVLLTCWAAVFVPTATLFSLSQLRREVSAWAGREPGPQPPAGVSLLLLPLIGGGSLAASLFIAHEGSPAQLITQVGELALVLEKEISPSTIDAAARRVHGLFRAPDEEALPPLEGHLGRQAAERAERCQLARLRMGAALEHDAASAEADLRGFLPIRREWMKALVREGRLGQVALCPEQGPLASPDDFHFEARIPAEGAISVRCRLARHQPLPSPGA